MANKTLVYAFNAISATQTSGDFDNLSGGAAIIFIDITAISGTTPTLAVTIQGKTPAGKLYTVANSSTLNSTGSTILRVANGLTAAASAVFNDVFPPTFNINLSVGGTTPSITGTVTVFLIDT